MVFIYFSLQKDNELHPVETSRLIQNDYQMLIEKKYSLSIFCKHSYLLVEQGHQRFIFFRVI